MTSTSTSKSRKDSTSTMYKAEDLSHKYSKLEKENEKLKKENEILKDRNSKLKEIASRLEDLNDMNFGTIDILKTMVTKSEGEETKLINYLTRQQRIFDNKVKHNFNVTNIYQEARYILEEVTELMRAIEKNDRENMIDELADIVIFAYGCAEVARLGSLDDKIFEKMAINEKREYKKTEEGDFIKTEGHKE